MRLCTRGPSCLSLHTPDEPPPPPPPCRIGLPCPPNYNPADFFISTLAIQPGKEDSCRKAIAMICDEFAKSEEGINIDKAVLENSKDSDVSGGVECDSDYEGD